jgi:hypothetical protein
VNEGIRGEVGRWADSVRVTTGLGVSYGGMCSVYLRKRILLKVHCI